MREELIERTTELILIEHAVHPRAELIDYYKLFFQAISGPGHLINNAEEARNYLSEEIRVMEDSEEPLFQDISYDGNDFCRVSLQTVRDNLISEKDFFERFFESAMNKLDNISMLNVWVEIEQLIYKLNVVGSGYDFQRKELDTLLKMRETFIPRHSETYRNEYKPHYRLLRNEYLKDIRSEAENPVKLDKGLR
jgi:hypothetical protein